MARNDANTDDAQSDDIESSADLPPAEEWPAVVRFEALPQNVFDAFDVYDTGEFVRVSEGAHPRVVIVTVSGHVKFWPQQLDGANVTSVSSSGTGNTTFRFVLE